MNLVGAVLLHEGLVLVMHVPVDLITEFRLISLKRSWFFRWENDVWMNF